MSNDVSQLHDELTVQYPRKTIKGFSAEYIETTSTIDSLPLLIILPGFLESIYAYAPTMTGLTGIYDVVTISYSGFTSFDEMGEGIATLFKEKNPKKIYFYGTSLGGLLTQLLLVYLITKKDINKSQIGGVILSHTAHIAGKILSGPSFEAVKSFGSIITYVPKRTLPPIYRARARLRKFVSGENPYTKEHASPEELLGYFFMYACDLFQASLPRVRLTNYMNLFQRVSHLDKETKKQVDDILEDIPILNIFSDTDTVMHHKRRSKAFSSQERVLPLKGQYGHRNPRYFQLAIVDAIRDFTT